MQKRTMRMCWSMRSLFIVQFIVVVWMVLLMIAVVSNYDGLNFVVEYSIAKSIQHAILIISIFIVSLLVIRCLRQKGRTYFLMVRNLMLVESFLILALLAKQMYVLSQYNLQRGLKILAIAFAIETVILVYFSKSLSVKRYFKI